MVNIRTANADDIPALGRLHYELHALHVKQEPHLFLLPDKAKWDAWFNVRAGEVLSTSAETIFLAEIDGQPVGFIHLVLRNAPPLPIFVPRLLCIVEEIGVTLSYQNSGIGKSLMVAAENWARKHGVDALELSVHDFNAQAISFYQKLGFSVYLHRMTRPIQ